MIWFRTNWGRSWRSGPGERRWVSHSTGYGFWGGLAYLTVLPVYWLLVALPLAMLWLYVELAVLVVSGLDLLLQWTVHPASRYRLSVLTWGWFWYFSTR